VYGAFLVNSAPETAIVLLAAFSQIHLLDASVGQDFQHPCRQQRPTE
jgi:hypothetical protein